MTTDNTKNRNVLDLFSEKPFLKICAPMVRYSKLQFRNLVRKYDCDLCFTPMILADSFCKSSEARANEFTTNLNDAPLIVQFAANTTHDFVGAASLVSPFCNGVDLNCGCPQSWARKQRLGCALLDTPDVIYDIVRQCRNQINKPFSVSAKIRILQNLKKTVEICRRLEKAGLSFITVHARTPSHSTGDINLESLRLIQEVTTVPVIANGGVRTLDDCFKLQDETKCQGVMVANGVLTNPSLFSGSNVTTLECVQDWLDICYNSTLTSDQWTSLRHKILDSPVISERPHNLTFQCFHHHLVFMLEKLLPKSKRRVFNNLHRFSEVLEFMQEEFGIVPRLFVLDEFKRYMPAELQYDDRLMIYQELSSIYTKNSNEGLKIYDYSRHNGDYFDKKLKSMNNDDADLGLTDLFFGNT